MKCEACKKDLTGRQLRFCSNACKMVIKNAGRAQRLSDSSKEIDRLKKQIARLKAQIKKLKS